MLHSDMRDSLVSQHFALVRNASHASRQPTRRIAMTYRHRTAYPGALCPAKERSVLRDVRDSLERLAAHSSYLHPREESMDAVMLTSTQVAHGFKYHTLPQEPPKTLMARRPKVDRLPYGTDDVMQTTYTSQYRAELCGEPHPTAQYEVLATIGRRVQPRPRSALPARRRANEKPQPPPANANAQPRESEPSSSSATPPAPTPPKLQQRQRPMSAGVGRKPASQQDAVAPTPGSSTAERPADRPKRPSSAGPRIARGPALAAAGAAARANALHHKELSGVRLAIGRHEARRRDEWAAAEARQNAAVQAVRSTMVRRDS